MTPTRYDPNEKGPLEKLKSAAEFTFWCVMVGGGLGLVYFKQHFGGLFMSVLGFFVGVICFSVIAIVSKLFWNSTTMKDS